jgi:hypothetical protein
LQRKRAVFLEGIILDAVSDADIAVLIDKGIDRSEPSFAISVISNL